MSRRHPPAAGPLPPLLRARLRIGAWQVAGYVLRVEQRGPWRCYLLQDLRSGELRRFRLAAQLQQRLRQAGRGGLK